MRDLRDINHIFESNIFIVIYYSLVKRYHVFLLIHMIYVTNNPRINRRLKK